VDPPYPVNLLTVALDHDRLIISSYIDHLLPYAGPINPTPSILSSLSQSTVLSIVQTLLSSRPHHLFLS
jgi:hypothetical protein